MSENILQQLINEHILAKRFSIQIDESLVIEINVSTTNDLRTLSNF
jgi:hypothetical protein